MRKNKITITKKSYDPISYLVKGTANAILGTKFKVSRNYDYVENGKVRSDKAYSFSEFKKKKGI